MTVLDIKNNRLLNAPAGGLVKHVKNHVKTITIKFKYIHVLKFLYKDSTVLPVVPSCTAIYE